ncbi:PQ loop repeat protein [Cordyceps fumosorosea ARSEF 2679]|uniref:PQ loop repeat protein n=1 Tax=Cordyceps fumosorosea (strain ARSEF 2679) TaxID=1081104 RepID=A0A167RN19_CORFA|nr:PQ loop repeat protein [Cordyceps fumosorosea ARSEF 2679]OAA58757.1 PQ loop repeat protein [Cordyceps fumosorosea ARSEF 2679]
MAPPTSTFHLDVEAISGICGSISIACWVVVFSPQIIQNFQRGNVDALSIQFIIVWLLGDVFNIIGAVMQGVLPTMIILAIYYTLADIVLLLQCFYYRGFTWKDPAPTPKPDNTSNERTALLDVPQERRGSDWTGLSPAVPHFGEPPKESPPPPTVVQTLLWNSLIVLMVCAAGVLGWFLGERAKGPREHKPETSNDELEFNKVGQFFGYLCAVAYIASRMPQLILNYRRKTTEGLSMLFFLFACLGNITYVLSIFAYEPNCGEKRCKNGEAGRIYARYILVNLSWLAGALVTLFMDFGVFAQYFIYKTNDDEQFTSEDEEESATDSVQINGRANGHNDRPQAESWDQRPLLQRHDSNHR